MKKSDKNNWEARSAIHTIHYKYQESGADFRPVFIDTITDAYHCIEKYLNAENKARKAREIDPESKEVAFWKEYSKAYKEDLSTFHLKRLVRDCQ